MKKLVLSVTLIIFMSMSKLQAASNVYGSFVETNYIRKVIQIVLRSLTDDLYIDFVPMNFENGNDKITSTSYAGAFYPGKRSGNINLNLTVNYHFLFDDYIESFEYSKEIPVFYQKIKTLSNSFQAPPPKYAGYNPFECIVSFEYNNEIIFKMSDKVGDYY